jgi:hypothetical protein
MLSGRGNASRRTRSLRTNPTGVEAGLQEGNGKGILGYKMTLNAHFQYRDDFLARQELTNKSSQSIPSLDAATRAEADTADDDDSQTMALEQPNARGETPIPRQQDETPQASPISPQHADPSRHPQSFYYPSHPLIYGYPPPRPGVPIPSPMPWPYMPNGHPIPMPMAMTMFPPPPSGHSENTESQGSTASMSAPAVATYAGFDYQQAQGYNAWMEYYAQMDPNVYTRQMEEHNAYPFQPMMGMDASDNDKRRRGRTRTRVCPTSHRSI